MKQAACLVCRRSKIKCISAAPQSRCERCIQLNCDCVRPGIHVGRQKGIKNKRVGLDNALHQIEQAVKRKGRGSGTQQLSAGDRERVVRRLTRLLNASPDDGDGDEGSSSRGSPEQENQEGCYAGLCSEDNSVGADGTAQESLGIDDAENPLQLLARASHFRPQSITDTQQSQSFHPQRSRPAPRNTRGVRGEATSHVEDNREPLEASALRDFFAPTKSYLDVGDDLDPVNLGLVTEEEAESLFSYFHTSLAHTRWGLDPRIYTVSFTRSRSAFLTTSIVAAAALFTPSAGALSKRLSRHVRTLANHVMVRGYRSVEIVLGFLVNIPWMFPGQHSTDDETCKYVSMATTVAIDISLHKVLVPIKTLTPRSNLNLARGECMDPRAALTIDGFPEVDPLSERGKLLLRGRERAWISLFVLERGMSLARGRPFIVPLNRFLKDCDNWHHSPLADPQDSHLVCMAVLRRNLDGLFHTVRALCDGAQTVVNNGSFIVQSIQTAIESFFDEWYTKWGASIRTDPDRHLPPYVEILVTHTRLSTYGSVINHPTAPLEARQFFHTAGLSSALNVMRVAIQGESQLQSMPNNTSIMISFAACFALMLSAYATDGSALALSVRKLIDETAGVLERIGTVTEHRNGLSILYGKYLRQIVRRTLDTTVPAGTTTVALAPSTQVSQTTSILPQDLSLSMAPTTFSDQQLLWPEAFQFSTMSDDQILQVLNQPGNEFEPSFEGLSWDDMNHFDWLSWPEFGV